MSQRTGTIEAARGQRSGGKGLAGGQLGLTAAVVIGISTIAPAYVLTSSLGPTVQSVGTQLPAIFIAVTVLGAAQAFERPTMAALLPGIVPVEALPRAIANSTSVMQTALVVGPSLAGLLYGVGPVVPFVVAGYITAGYWFTSSTSFANLALTLACALTDTFTGIRPQDVPGFVLAQIGGGLAATLLFHWLFRKPAEVKPAPVSTLSGATISGTTSATTSAD